MYEYKYVPYRTGGGFWFGNNGGHREVIDKHAAEGWRFVGYIPLAFTGHGGTEEVHPYQAEH